MFKKDWLFGLNVGAWKTTPMCSVEGFYTNTIAGLPIRTNQYNEM